VKQESKQDIILRLTEGLNAQQRSVPQLPADAQARKIKVLGSKTDPKHPFDGYMVGADESADPVGDYVDEADFNPARRGFLKKAGAVAATAAMPTGLAGAAAKAMAPAASWASTLSAPLAGLTAVDLDNIINLLMSSKPESMISGKDPYDLDIMKSIAQDAARESWGNPWMEGNAAKAFLDAVELGRKKGMDGEDIIQDLFIVTKKQYMQELKKLSPEEVAKVKSQSLNPDNKSKPAASPTTGMSGLARAAGAQIGRTMKNIGRDTANTVLNQPAKSAALPAPTASTGMQIPKQKSRVAANQDKELGETSGIYNPDGKTFRESLSPFNDDHSELDQFVKEEFNRHPDDINEESGAVVAHGYAYNRQDQRVAWTREFASEAEAKEWARRRNATVLSIVPKDSIEEGWKSKLAGAALAGAAAFGGGGAQAQTTAPTGVNATGNNAAIVQSLVNPVAQQRFAKMHADTTAKLTDPRYNHNPNALGQHQAAPKQQHAEMLQNIKNIEQWDNPYRIIQMAMNMAGVTPQEVLQNLPQGYKLPTTEPKTAPVRLPGDPGYVREGAGTVGGNNPAAAWPEFGTAKTYESQLAEAKQQLAEAESRYVLYFNGKPASHYATEAEAKRIADSIKAKNPTVKIEIKNEMREDVAEGAKVDRMVRHIASSEKATGKSNKDAENIAWATVNKRGYLDNKNKKKHVAEAGTPTDIRAKNRAVVKKIQGKEVKEDITQEDIITKLKARLGDYLSDLGQQIKKDPALQDKLSAETPGDQVGPPVKTLTTDDGHEISIHGNEDDGFRISIKNRQTPSKFSSLDEAVMACEMYRAHRRRQALTADYVDEA
jgi:hypothetical protein